MLRPHLTRQHRSTGHLASLRSLRGRTLLLPWTTWMVLSSTVEYSLLTTPSLSASRVVSRAGPLNQFGLMTLGLSGNKKKRCVVLRQRIELQIRLQETCAGKKQPKSAKEKRKTKLILWQRPKQRICNRITQNN